jgi:Fe-S oxidoreductase
MRNGEIRIREAVSLGAKIMATSCPFCLLTFEDAVKISGLTDQIVVKISPNLLLSQYDRNKFQIRSTCLREAASAKAGEIRAKHRVSDQFQTISNYRN